jgi:hypothetical protein
LEESIAEGYVIISYDAMRAKTIIIQELTTSRSGLSIP